MFDTWAFFTVACYVSNCKSVTDQIFQVRRKDFWLLSTVGKLLKDFIPRLSHEADGLIFQVLSDSRCFCSEEMGIWDKHLPLR